MPFKINCRFFLYGGRCGHPCAPKHWFRTARCLLLEDVSVTDPRIRITCAVQEEYADPRKISKGAI